VVDRAARAFYNNYHESGKRTLPADIGCYIDNRPERRFDFAAYGPLGRLIFIPASLLL
jgi:hypothetical protein